MKKILISVGIVLLICTGCSKESELRMTYQGEDGKLSYDINNYMEPSVANYLSENYSVVAEEENQMKDDAITAISSLIFNDTSKEVIFSNNVYEKIYPASTTKILTALLALKYGDLSDEVTIKADNAGITAYGAKLCNFKEGDVVTLGTLLNCLLVYSGNDAAVAIAEHMSGSEEAFVEWMNEEAANIGATNTHFVNSHGLHNANHYTTAYDIYLIFKECLKYDDFKKIINQTSYTANYLDKSKDSKSVVFETTNMFLLGTMDAPDGITVIGGKTGSTSYAGDCLILYSEGNDGTGYITEVFKASSKTDLYAQIVHLFELSQKTE